jgi:ATP-dependent protease ClpP protease subunit
MDKIKQIMNNRPSKNMGCDISPRALEKWNPAVNASESGKNTISILDVIGDDFWGEGVTAKRVAAALRSIGENNDVEVIINSPGGDLFEGLAIYSLLKEHKGKVTVKVLSLAASAASVIAMAGDEIKIARAGFFMIHNTWVFGIGNRHDLREIADWLEPFDSAMADIYQSQTGMDIKKIVSMLDNETWIGGTAAIEQGFADSYLDSDEIKEDNKNNAKFSAQKLDLIMAKSGIPRSERRKLIADIKGSTQNATDMQNAVTFNEPLVKLTFEHKLEV